ncbi:hypothetical protein LOTGIDRAFT_173225 [Lottia gigantea]|uniref:Uncharacterized protein n=1 Tax=Lottia gigantea TaxID=225164 RepID=V4B282_LOTGI|nr:hypothetical protein LOTGIDRAFT_173225 [Lottia gigantea]ESP00372.1 hypothetical protein LOTGIDRAFT_173225 [Lottia gigantea]
MPKLVDQFIFISNKQLKGQAVDVQSEIKKRDEIIIRLSERLKESVKYRDEQISLQYQQIEDLKLHLEKLQQEFHQILVPACSDSRSNINDSGSSIRDSGSSIRDSGCSTCDSGFSICDSGCSVSSVAISSL